MPKPQELLGMSEEKLRGAGLSRNKLASLRDLAAKTLAGVVPTQEQARSMSDAELIERLTEVRGIGVWTVHMLLIFRLGRPDVMPTGDFAIRRAFGLLYKKRGHPKPDVVDRHASKWAPYRTVASWYLWRSLDAA
jgi:DNA-3-methyladenine glycosylase II